MVLGGRQPSDPSYKHTKQVQRWWKDICWIVQVEQFKLDSASRCFRQLKNQTNSLTVKAEVYSGKSINAFLPNRQTFWSRTGELGKAQPDNYNGQKAGRQDCKTINTIVISTIYNLNVLLNRLDNVKDKSGLTVEGLQEYYDEACLAVLNNRSGLIMKVTMVTASWNLKPFLCIF